MLWGSLRWSDVQWVSPCELIFDDECVRGCARRTKATKRGMPFGIIQSGFLGHTTSVSWTSRWMNILREAIHRTSLKYNGFVPDFIIPAVGGDPDQPVLLAPLTRAQGILLLRKFLLTSSPSMDVSHIGVHSCKVTFLSWSRQLGIDEELRRHQGHHRSNGGNQCVDPLWPR